MSTFPCNNGATPYLLLQHCCSTSPFSTLLPCLYFFYAVAQCLLRHCCSFHTAALCLLFPRCYTMSNEICIFFPPCCGILPYYSLTKSEGYSFCVVRASILPFRPSVHTFCLSRTISRYLLVRFDSFLVQIMSTIDSRYPISLVKIDSPTLELLPLFWYRQLKGKTYISFFV